jgi:hypothetical protein
LSGGTFAAQLGVKEGTLRHWRRQLAHDARAQSSKAVARPTFLEISAPSSEDETDDRLELVFPDEVRLLIPERFDDAVLSRVVAVLRGR